MGYVVRYSPAGGIDIVIINDKITTNNKISEKNGDLIQVEYILHDGSIANFEDVVNFNNINFIFTDTLVNPITGLDYNGSDIFDIQTYSQIPGTSPDSLEKVRALIGINSRTEVLTSPEHFKAFLSRFGSVGYSKTWSEPRSMRVFSRIVKNFRSKILQGYDNPNATYLKLTKSDFILSENEKKDIKIALNNSGQLLVGTLYDILDMDINRYALYVYVKLKNNTGGTTNQDQLSLKNNIENTIINFFIKTDIDGFIGKSEIINEIYENLTDTSIKKHIDSIDIYIISEDLEKAKKSGFYDKKEYIYHPIQGYKYVNTKRIALPGLSNNSGSKINETDLKYLGLDKHGNIDTTLTPNKLPILAGGFSWKNSSDQLIYIDPEKPVLIEIN